jgi:hypothetical protein
MITPSYTLTATERVLPRLTLDFTSASLNPLATFARITGSSNPATFVNSLISPVADQFIAAGNLGV